MIGNPEIRFQANEGVQKSISNNIRYMADKEEKAQYHAELEQQVEQEEDIRVHCSLPGGGEEGDGGHAQTHQQGASKGAGGVISALSRFFIYLFSAKPRYSHTLWNKGTLYSQNQTFCHVQLPQLAVVVT